MKIKTNMILNEKEKIVLIVISSKEIMIEHKFNKGIKNYVKWLEKENERFDVIIEENKTIIKFDCDIRVFAPNIL